MTSSSEKEFNSLRRMAECFQSTALKMHNVLEKSKPLMIDAGIDEFEVDLFNKIFSASTALSSFSESNDSFDPQSAIALIDEGKSALDMAFALMREAAVNEYEEAEYSKVYLEAYECGKLVPALKIACRSLFPASGDRFFHLQPTLFLENSANISMPEEDVKVSVTCSIENLLPPGLTLQAKKSFPNKQYFVASSVTNPYDLLLIPEKVSEFSITSVWELRGAIFKQYNDAGVWKIQHNLSISLTDGNGSVYSMNPIHWNPELPGNRAILRPYAFVGLERGAEMQFLSDHPKRQYRASISTDEDGNKTGIVIDETLVLEPTSALNFLKFEEVLYPSTV